MRQSLISLFVQIYAQLIYWQVMPISPPEGHGECMPHKNLLRAYRLDHWYLKSVPKIKDPKCIHNTKTSIWKYIILINRRYFAFLGIAKHHITQGGNEKMQKECEPLERTRIAVIYDFEGSFFFSPQTVGMRQCPHWLLLEWRVATKGHPHKHKR